MSYIFLDESGDLGFNFEKGKTSKYFVVTCLFADNKRAIEKIVKKTHLELHKKVKNKKGVLHSVKERPITRQRLLKRLVDKKCFIMVIYLNKNKVYTRLQNEKVVLYNYVTNILLGRIITKNLLNKKEKIYLIASKRETNKFLNKNFQNYIKLKTQNKVILDILIKTPAEEKSLQAVDFASWAIFRKYEYADDSYYNLIKSLIIEESPLFP